MLMGLPQYCRASGMFADARADGFPALFRRIESIMCPMRDNPYSILNLVSSTFDSTIINIRLYYKLTNCFTYLTWCMYSAVTRTYIYVPTLSAIIEFDLIYILGLKLSSSKLLSFVTIPNFVLC